MKKKTSAFWLLKYYLFIYFSTHLFLYIYLFMYIYIYFYIYLFISTFFYLYIAYIYITLSHFGIHCFLLTAWRTGSQSCRHLRSLRLAPQ